MEWAGGRGRYIFSSSIFFLFFDFLLRCFNSLSTQAHNTARESTHKLHEHFQFKRPWRKNTAEWLHNSLRQNDVREAVNKDKLSIGSCLCYHVLLPDGFQHTQREREREGGREREGNDHHPGNTTRHS